MSALTPTWNAKSKVALVAYDRITLGDRPLWGVQTMKVVPKGATQQTGEFVRRTTRNAADDVVVLFFDENNEKRMLSPNEMPPVFVDKQWYDTVARSLFGNGPTWSDFAANGKCAFLISAGIFTGLLYFDPSSTGFPTPLGPPEGGRHAPTMGPTLMPPSLRTVADGVDATATAIMAVTFRINHLVRLRSFNHIALDGKLVRIDSDINEATGKFEVTFLDDQDHPPVPVVPARGMLIAPKHFIHTCEYCLVAASAAVDGGRLQMCWRCKTARYCNAACQRADWERHKDRDCFDYSHVRGCDTPLQKACIHGSILEVRRLVEVEGADVDKASSNGPTPLATAAMYGHLSIVRYLVEEGADMDKARATSLTPLRVAAQEGFLQIVRYLVEQGADKDKTAASGTTPLYIAAHQGHLQIVYYLVEQGTDIDKARDNGETPLYIAAQNNHLAVARYLVEQGADKDKADSDGTTPLMAAEAAGHAEVAAYLRAAGAGEAAGAR